MANQISVTVVNVGGNPLPSSQTQSFLTSNIVVTAETTAASSTANAKIYYFDSPFQLQIFYVEETVAEIVTAANTDGTSQVALTCYSISGYPQKQSLAISVPASGFATQTVSDSPVNTIVSFMKLTFGVSETEADIVTAANTGGGGGGGSTLFALTGTNTATGSVTGDLDGNELRIEDGADNYSTFNATSVYHTRNDGSFSTGFNQDAEQFSFTSINAAETVENIFNWNQDGGLITLATGKTFAYAANYAPFSGRQIPDAAWVLSQIPSPGIGGSIANTQIAYGNGTAITGAAAFVYNGTTTVTLNGSTLNSTSGSFLRIGSTNGVTQFFTSGSPATVSVYDSAASTSLDLVAITSAVATINTTGHNNLRLQTAAAGGVAIGNFNPTAKLHIAASTTSLASLRIGVGVAPSAPNDQDIWFEDNTNTGFKVRINGVTKTITVS